MLSSVPFLQSLWALGPLAVPLSCMFHLPSRLAPSPQLYISPISTSSCSLFSNFYTCCLHFCPTIYSWCCCNVNKTATSLLPTLNLTSPLGSFILVCGTVIPSVSSQKHESPWAPRPPTYNWSPSIILSISPALLRSSPTFPWAHVILHYYPVSPPPILHIFPFPILLLIRPILTWVSCVHIFKHQGMTNTLYF